MEPARDPEGVEVQHLSRIEALAGAQALEIGAGDGRLTRRYIERVAAAACIDVDLELLTKAAVEEFQAGADRVSFLQARAEQLPFRDGSFEVVMLAWSL